jgi:L-threonylcarbamoyladenylate synthase
LKNSKRRWPIRLFKSRNKSIKLHKVDPEHPDSDVIRKAANIIRGGGVVVFPTHSLYGMAANAFDKTAVDQIFRIKKRPSRKPLLLLIKNRDDILQLARCIPPPAQSLMDQFWPGKLTIIVDAVDELPKRLTAGTGRIGIRLTAHPVARSLIAATGTPITGTSANLSGKPGCSQISRLHSAIARKVDMILDAGPLKAGGGSTVVEVSDEEVLMLREGPISSEELKTTLRK